ncbi:MAG: aquaporin Z [Deltaproteobacteria bacterium]|nr:aquaporin Z [Deltaproteobacteria bacterium]
MNQKTRSYWAEFVGTFVLVLGGVGTAVLAGPSVGQVGIALAFGFSLLVMVYAIGPISGCHVNPAVTLAFLLRGRVNVQTAVGYWIAQFCGAFVAALCVWLIARGNVMGFHPAATGFGANGYGAHSPGGFNAASAFLCEVLMSAIFVLTVLTATQKRAPVGFAGLAIGLMLTLVHLVSIPVTNTSVNPARSFAPALFVGGWALGQLWMFIVAPALGAVLAASVDGILREPSERGGEVRIPTFHRGANVTP